MWPKCRNGRYLLAVIMKYWDDGISYIILWSEWQYSYRKVFSPQLPIASDLKSGTANKSSLGSSYRTSVNFSMADSSFGASPATYRNWSKRSTSEKTYTGLSPASVPVVFETNSLMTNAIMCVAIGGIWTKMSRVSLVDLLKSIFAHSQSAFLILYNY